MTELRTDPFALDDQTMCAMIVYHRQAKKTASQMLQDNLKTLHEMSNALSQGIVPTVETMAFVTEQAVMNYDHMMKSEKIESLWVKDLKLNDYWWIKEGGNPHNMPKTIYELEAKERMTAKTQEWLSDIPLGFSITPETFLHYFKLKQDECLVKPENLTLKK